MNVSVVLCVVGVAGRVIVLCAVGARVWGGVGGGGAERMDVEGARRSAELLAPVCPLAHSPVAIH